MPAVLASSLFAILLLLALFGAAHGCIASWFPTKSVVSDELRSQRPGQDCLFVLVHGYQGGSRKARKGWDSIERTLGHRGDVLRLGYDAGTFSNADPLEVSAGIREAIRKHHGRYQHVVLIGHSIGAVLVRRAVVQEWTTRPGDTWAGKVDRLVLLAGMNRGWDVSGRKPLDMYWHRKLAFRWGTWLGEMTHYAGLIRSMKTGEPFIQGLRLDWMTLQNPPRVVQLLGDIDDVVSDEDNKDLLVTGGTDFVWIKVRGTGHASILDLDDTSSAGIGGTLGAYRADKLLLAATKPWTDVVASNEESRLDVDEAVKHVVFVLHGIRDLGKWAAGFDQELQREYRKLHTNGDKLAVVSVRYGYFGMGQFLLNPSRERYVRWFADQYTETLARYPNAERFDFVGHSNGTYLLAAAMTRYSSMKMHRIVFGGSVVPRNFAWKSSRVGTVRNYVATGDCVVALFPRLFETRPMQFVDSDVGSAGFNGFTWSSVPAPDRAGGRFQNIFIKGGHSAFLKHGKEIARYLVADQELPIPQPQPKPAAWLKVSSEWLVGLVWLAMLAIILLLGRRVMGAADYPSLPALALYIVAVVVLLRWV